MKEYPLEEAVNDYKRECNTKAGRSMFSRDYDPVKHGEQIRKAVQELY